MSQVMRMQSTRVGRRDRPGRPPVPDHVIAAAIVDALSAAGRPVGPTELRRMVRHQGQRVDDVARLLVAAGHVRRVGRSGLVVGGGPDGAA